MIKAVFYSLRLFNFVVLFSIAFGMFGCSSSQMQSNNNQQSVTDEQISRSITEFQNRKIYTNLSEKDIDEIPDDKLEQAIFDNLVSKMNKEMSDEAEVFAKFSKPQQYFYSVWGVQAEVNNGGFNQYYFNSTGQYAYVAEEAFKNIGAIKFADLMRRANEIYTKNEKQINSTNDGTLEGFSKSYENNPLNAMDDEFYKLERQENIQQLLIDYVRKNKKAFAN